MSPASFATSPGAVGEQRKFVNPTPGYVGVNIFGPDGTPTAIAVEPGGEVWLTEAEERMTAEAPRLAQDNPFTKEWEEPVDWNEFGEITRTVTRQGILALVDEPPRPTASDRFTPPRQEALPEPEPEETVTGAPEIPEQPPVQGQPSPDEVVGTPEAPVRNDEALAAREPTAEQPTRRRRSRVEDEPGLPV
jgi:hypothetical protein